MEGWHRPTPLVAWQAQVNGEPMPSKEESLHGVYQHWSNRFKKRAEFHVLLAMAILRAWVSSAGD
ncbi:MAG: hypothetical protein GWP61_19125 [Chloroflexi bacterium]|jgi:hypothetical protein|nr:hypothetical protein [Chloroflexota bacterium]